MAMGYIYAKDKKWAVGGHSITIYTGGTNPVITLTSGDKTYKEVIDEILGSYTTASISQDTEFLKFSGIGTYIAKVFCSSTLLADLLGLEKQETNLGTVGEYYAENWGYKIPRTTVHELASLQGGFTPNRSPVELFRQRETKVTSIAVYDINFMVRRGFTYAYRLDKRHVDHFDKLLALWKEEIIVATDDDMFIDEGVLQSTTSGIVTFAYKDHNIMESTITLLGGLSGQQYAIEYDPS